MDSQSGENKTPSPQVLEIALDLWRQSGGQHSFPIAGTSMQPLFQEGDTILVSHANKDIVRGDVVVFRQNGELVAHRVVAIEQTDGAGSLYYTRGDNSPHLDPPLRSQDVLGRVIAIQHGERVLSIDGSGWRWLNRQIVNYRSLPKAQTNILERILRVVSSSVLTSMLALFRWWIIRPWRTGRHES